MWWIQHMSFIPTIRPPPRSPKYGPRYPRTSPPHSAFATRPFWGGRRRRSRSQGWSMTASGTAPSSTSGAGPRRRRRQASRTSKKQEVIHFECDISDRGSNFYVGYFSMDAACLFDSSHILPLPSYWIAGHTPLPLQGPHYALWIFFKDFSQTQVHVKTRQIA